MAEDEVGSGYKHVGASLTADYAINREWTGVAALRYKRLLGGAADSPIVSSLGDRDQVSTSIGIQYRF